MAFGTRAPSMRSAITQGDHHSSSSSSLANLMAPIRNRTRALTEEAVLVFGSIMSRSESLLRGQSKRRLRIEDDDVDSVVSSISMESARHMFALCQAEITAMATDSQTVSKEMPPKEIFVSIKAKDTEPTAFVECSEMNNLEEEEEDESIRQIRRRPSSPMAPPPPPHIFTDFTNDPPPPPPRPPAAPKNTTRQPPASFITTHPNPDAILLGSRHRRAGSGTISLGSTSRHRRAGSGALSLGSVTQAGSTTTAATLAIGNYVGESSIFTAPTAASSSLSSIMSESVHTGSSTTTNQSYRRSRARRRFATHAKDELLHMFGRVSTPIRKLTTPNPSEPDLKRSNTGCLT